ncbi:MAG: cation:proton antiporter [Deltaproteobacteria bacterium]|nr:cation:proton antiporter [Deltaproteobacteria bacterium]
MNESFEPFAIPVMLVGLLLVIDLLLQAILRRTAVPSVVVHLAVGFALALADWRWGWLGVSGRGVIDLLGSVGIVFLLFRVGLESHISKLLENLRAASFIWIANVSVSGALGFLAARYGFGLELVPSLFVAVAMTATSVGVCVAAWREERALDSKRGQLLLDVAELDDVSAIVLMAVLFAVAPLLHDGQTGTLALSVGRAAAEVLIRLALFGLALGLFARFVEAPLTRLVGGFEPAPDRLITVVSVGLIVAAAAGALGFSLAIGAFFAGLVFSRDPEAVKLDANFDPLYDFFTPFFFIAIGMRVDPESLGGALPLGLLLFLVAAGGKLLGGGGGSLVALQPRGAVLLGISLMPRAEIAMVIMQHGMLLGAWAVSERLFSAMVVVSLLTCLVAPIAIRIQLRRETAPASPERPS